VKPRRLRIPPLPEDVVQEQIVQAIRLQYDCLVASRPNEGRGGKDRNMAIRMAMKLKRMGLLAGMPDVDVFWSPGQIGMLEVKNLVGFLQPSQREIHGQLRALGFRVEVVRSVEAAFHALDAWGVPKRARISCPKP
jgi:hypothetical protein